ncbi:MAG: hypothetical protein IIA70_05025 [Proteobacteria bacterium]|nr:hypothetical protein [Pseudomonadota bacterium]
MPIEYGDETVTLVEIDQPFCLETYGVAPCVAALGTTGTKKCYNTRFTCQDSPNYNPADKVLKFSFSQEGIKQYGLVIPSLQKVNTSPLRVNIGAMDPDMGAFGERETVTLTFNDHKHSDLVVDQYRTERLNAHGQGGIEGFDPYERGTFWAKWLVRNPYHEGYAVRIKEGVMGDLETDLRVRHYVIDKIDGPSNGRVTVHLKDLFSLVEDRKTQAPVANTGELSANITAGDGSLTLFPGGIGNTEYAASGRVAIGDEIMDFTRVADVLTLTARGVLNTTAAAHENEDKVQQVLEYAAQRPDTIIKDLLTTFTEITLANIPVADWTAEIDNFLPTLYTAYIAEPTPVLDLIAELAEQVGFTMWPDVETNLIRLKAVGSNIVPVVTADDDAWVIADSMTIERDPDQRVSRVQVFYGQINPLEDLDDEKNYRSRVESIDLAAESSDQYGTKSIRQVFSRWIPQFGRATATTVSDLLLTLFRDPPFRAKFDLDIQRAGQLVIADPFTLKTRAVVDDLGAVDPNTLLPMAIARGETSLAIEAQKLNLFTLITQERIINIDDDVNNVNLRTLHDSLYIPPVSGVTVKFIIGAGVIVGGDNGTPSAMETGSWPDGVILSLELKATAFICGPGGNGGNANGTSANNGTPGGLALLCQFAMEIINNGVLGGGGGGGGGATAQGSSIGTGGGGGAGTNNLQGGNQVKGGNKGSSTGASTQSTDGTLQNGGVGATAFLSSGGDGGDLGAPGNIGTLTLGEGLIGSGGPAGVAVDGDSLVTYNPLGDIRGARIN